MIDDCIVELVASKVRFFSQNDEAAFFEWLNKLTCLNSYEGRGANLYIYINRISVDEGNLRELLSLFRRFDVEMAQLSVFDNELFENWFRNKKSYWYEAIFNSDK